MLDQETCSPPVIVTLPAQINTTNAEQAVEQISVAFAPGVTIVVADLTSTASRDRATNRANAGVCAPPEVSSATERRLPFRL